MQKLTAGIARLFGRNTDDSANVSTSPVRRAIPSLSEKDLSQITPYLKSEHYNNGEVIIKQGDAAGDFYVIVKGEVEVYETGANGEKQIAILGPAQYFGEIASRQDMNRTANVRALDEVEVLRMPPDKFNTLIETSELSREEMDNQISVRVAQLIAMRK